MRIAHLADLHLGYRAYPRQGPDGVNQRERDISDAVALAFADVAAAGPDLVLVAGDVFHSARPSNTAIMAAFRHFSALRRGLPGAPIVLIAGSHDSPRAAGGGGILRLLGEIPDVHVVDDAARAVRLEALSASVFCVPHVALWGEAPPVPEPDPTATTNVLLVHGAVAAGSRAGADVAGEWRPAGEYGGMHVERAALGEDAWEYVALGHYHTAARLAPHVWYAGATERTAPDVWAEASSRKGWVLFDAERGEGEHRAVRARDVVDLPPVSARRAGEPAEWLTAQEIDARIEAAVASIPGGVAGKVVRLVVTDLPRDLFRALDHGRIRELRAEALHFHLEPRRPEAGRAVEAAGARRPTLEAELERFLSAWEPETPDIDRARLVALGAEYLESGSAPPPDAGPGDGDRR